MPATPATTNTRTQNSVDLLAIAFLSFAPARKRLLARTFRRPLTSGDLAPVIAGKVARSAAVNDGQTVAVYAGGECGNQYVGSNGAAPRAGCAAACKRPTRGVVSQAVNLSPDSSSLTRRKRLHHK